MAAKTRMNKPTSVKVPKEELVCYPCGRVKLEPVPDDSTRMQCVVCGTTYSTSILYPKNWLDQQKRKPQ